MATSPEPPAPANLSAIGAEVHILAKGARTWRILLV
jgi:hypothetical protein